MTTPTFNKDSGAIQTGIAALQDHVGAMIQAGQTAYRIREDLRSGYIAGSSSVFQNRLDAWIANYNQVMKTFENLGMSTEAVDRITDQAEDNAGLHGASWGSDSEIYDVLTPGR